MSADEIVLYYAPRTRSFTALWLLEELGVEYRLHSFDLNSGSHKEPEYLALNPMGKVPLVVDRGRPVAESGAIAIYMSDLYRDAGLAPALDAPERPAYLRWIFFATAIVEPALGEKFFKWDVPARSVAWGSFDQMHEVARAGVEPGPYLLGEEFSAADVMVASALRFGTMFGAIPNEDPIKSYVERCASRPACLRAGEIEVREGARFPRPT